MIHEIPIPLPHQILHRFCHVLDTIVSHGSKFALVKLLRIQLKPQHSITTSLSASSLVWSLLTVDN